MKQLTLFFLAISMQAFSQDTLNTADTVQMRWRIGVVVSPDLCYRTLAKSDGAHSDFIVKERNEREIPKAGYTAGITVCHSLNRHWALETGLLFSNKGYRTKMIDAIFYEDPGDPTANLSKIGTVTSYYYLDVPLKVNLFCGRGKIRFSATLGVVASLFLEAKEKLITEYTDGSRDYKTVKSDNKYNDVGVAPMAGFGIDWKLSKKLNLRMEPVFRYGLIKVIDRPVSDCLWTTGLNIGCYYAIK